MAMFPRIIGPCAGCGGGGRGTLIRPLWLWNNAMMIPSTMESGRQLGGGNHRNMRRAIHKQFTNNPKFENPEMSATQSGGGEGSVSIELLRKKLEDFNNERGWLPHHSPRNLLLALVGEMGELSEIFQWKGEVERGIPGWKEEEKLHLGEELSDVLLYLIQLSDSCGVDLGATALRKLHLNSLKYPPPPPQPSGDNSSNNNNSN